MIKYLTLLLFFPILISAALKDDLNKFFDTMGTSSNISSGDVYQGQKAGYATGGGISLRNPAMNTKLATVNLPEFDAGCGGIDIFSGGMSFIKSEQLISTLKSIGSGAGGYAFLLGMETVSPQIANTIRQLQSWANTINGLSINSCETASSLVGSVWPRNEMASQHICKTSSASGGIFKDHISARHNCADREEVQKSKKSVSQSNAALLVGEYNLAWKAIQQQSFFSSKKELSELFMTITGTIVVRSENGKDSIKTYPSKIQNSSFLKILLEGGTSTLYKCKDADQCLLVEEKEIHIPPSDAWVGKIQALLLSIQNKVIDDEELNEDEKSLLAKSHLPLYKIVSVISAYKDRISPIDLYQIADVVAMDMIAQCLKDGLEMVRAGCKQLKIVQLFDEEIDNYLNDIDRVASEIKHYETKTHLTMEREMQILQKMQLLEQQISQELFLFR